MKAWTTGNVAGTGTFRCTDCEYAVSLDAADELPTCPNCGGTEFVRASLFTTAQATVVDMAPQAEDDLWLEELREELNQPGQYLAYRTPEGQVVTFPLEREWTRIGRSLAADVRFDDPTVSRRHALRVRPPAGLRVLDDRSLTGVVVNGNNAALAGVQRSMLDSIVYTFNQAVTLAATNAFTIGVHSGQTGTAPTLAWAAISPDASGSSRHPHPDRFAVAPPHEGEGGEKAFLLEPRPCRR